MRIVAKLFVLYLTYGMSIDVKTFVFEFLHLVSKWMSHSLRRSIFVLHTEINRICIRFKLDRNIQISNIYFVARSAKEINTDPVSKLGYLASLLLCLYTLQGNTIILSRNLQVLPSSRKWRREKSKELWTASSQWKSPNQSLHTERNWPKKRFVVIVSLIFLS